MKYNLPGETAKILSQILPSHHSQNLGLVLDKYVPAGVVDKEEAEDKKKDERGNWLRKIAQEYQVDAKLVSAAYHRWYSYTSALGATHFKAEVDWRMVVGLGGNGVLETDLTLHPLYGLPIIPGSALKGLARTYAAMEDKEMYITGSDGQLKPSTEIDTDHDDIQRIFGMQDRVGTVIFFDAFPRDGQATFVLDIMNPHYPDYYQKNAAPTNDQNPVPIAFLAVERTTYMFGLALRQGVSEKYKKDLDTASGWLEEALRRYGIGGKTSAGYGYFKQGTPQSPLPEAAYASPVEASEPYIRPNIPRFTEGQKIPGTVLDPQKDAEALKRMQADEASFCLRFKEFPTKIVLMVIPPEFGGTENWRPGNTKHCVFLREEARDNCTILICRP